MKSKVRLYWIDMIVDEPDKVSKFYEEVAGFQRDPVPETDDHVSYSMQNEASEDILGICAAAVFPNWPGGWLPYIEIEDYESAMKKVEDAGGEIVEEMVMNYVFQGQKRSVVKDPSGAYAVFCEMPPENRKG